MYDSEMRVAMVKHRVSVLHRKRENCLSAMLSALCLLLMGSLVGVISAFSGKGQSCVRGLYGATMLFEDAGGYVLVGALAFVVAVAITVLCIHYREKVKKINKNTED